jgi:uncharacterized protein involved in outer membrane biogenesis
MRKRIIVIAVAAAIGLTLLSVTFWAQRNKDFLIGQAERDLGRRISVERIEVTYWPLGARLVNFTLADDPAFSAEDFVRANALRVELRLLPLFIGRFIPKRMTLESPSITVVRDARGRYNFDTRGGKEKNRRRRDRGAETSPVEREDSRSFWAPALDISDGTLRFRDLTDGSELTATQINLKTTEMESGDPFEIHLAAAVMAAKPNLQLVTQIGSIGDHRDFRDVPLAGEINATDLDLGKVNKALPQFRKALPRALRFDGIYTIKELKFAGSLNNLSLKGAVTGTDASFRFE